MLNVYEEYENNTYGDYSIKLVLARAIRVPFEYTYKRENDCVLIENTKPRVAAGIE